ncbi:MAG: hypothetical protein LC687_05050, partial [Actinobacteria bacterium]|nr:hypothetical protein [Actinomycetota bacterium]
MKSNWRMVAVAVGVSLVAMCLGGLAGCETITGDGWITEKKESAIDGQTIVVSKDFETDEGTTVLRAKLSCIVNSKDASLAIESYNKKEQQG